VRRYLAGDRGAGDELAERFQPLVGRIVQRVLGPRRREEWEDARQAVFLRLFGRLSSWRGRAPFCKWLAVVAARRAIDFIRAPDPAGPLPAEEPADRRPAPADLETRECIARAVAAFPPEWRTAFELVAQGTPREEVARRLGRSVRTVHYWLAEMRDQLARRLGGTD
jgi:RNA polymerase sigma factor (sigma-70 family)